jgi:tetratricopeptide (TPR) repeat protein
MAITRDQAGKLLQKIYSKVRGDGMAQPFQPQYSSFWQRFLKSKGAYHSLDDMLNMRLPTSSVTRGFGQDLRFSPSFDYYVEQKVYQDILSIPEPNFGNPQKIFCGIGGEKRSGIFLRNACYAYEIITKFNRPRNDSFNILEIGPGFGMLAYILKHYYKNAKLFLVDLPETLAICAWYLENTFPRLSFSYCPADPAPVVTDVTFVNAEAFVAGMSDYDLVINCDSMSEMTKDVACNYLRIVEADIHDGGMFFSLNKEGLDKEAIARPTLYPFSARWIAESVQSTHVGFLDDYRHIQMCLRWSDRQAVLPELRNLLLDLAYQYFYKERLECFALFRFVECYDQHPNDLGYMAFRICMIVFCDLLIDAHRESEAKPIVAAIAAAPESFSEAWATGRILGRLNKKEQAKRLLARSIEFDDVSPTILLKAGKLLEALGHKDLSVRAFNRVLNEGSCPLEKIEAATKLQMEVSQTDDLFSTLPPHAFSIGYYTVRMADILYRNGHWDRAHDMLLPVVMGHPRRARALIQKAIRLGHNDNGFYRKIGLFFERKGDYPSALKYLKRSLDIDASWASTHSDLAGVYRKLGRGGLEARHLKKALLCTHNKEVDYGVLYERLDFLDGGKLI